MGEMNIGYPEINKKTWLRKYRWFIEIDKAKGASNVAICHASGRPSVTLEEKDLCHVTEKIFHPVRATWEPIKIIIWEESTDKDLWKWLNKIYDVPSGDILDFPDYVSEIKIKLKDGKGVDKQVWKLEEAWIANLTYDSLDYSSIEFSTCEATIRYSRAILEKP